MRAPIPAALTVELNCIFPRYSCYVTDNRGTANGGFWKGFRTHEQLWTWLEKHSFVFTGGY